MTSTAERAPMRQPRPMPTTVHDHRTLGVHAPARVCALLGEVLAAAQLHRQVPSELRLAATVAGSDVAMAALYTGRADLAILGREATEPELKAFEWVYREQPGTVVILNGSLRTPGLAPALAVLVHAENPLTELSTAQLSLAFGAGDNPEKTLTWGDLGARGSWRGERVNLYAPAIPGGTGRFIRTAVLGGSTRLRWASLTEYAEPAGPAPEPAQTWPRRVGRAVESDRCGLGLGVVPGVAARVRALEVAGAQGRAVSLTTATVCSGEYPLARRVHAYYNANQRGRPAEKVARFLRFLLAPQGQRIVGSWSDSYLPLTPAAAQVGLGRLA